ncbi:hypothetical protein BRDCF_p1329 [Bacteroidales bacterium CF]|nr:hypothetical protein BRDCF_p1329 [Bacteroidales bacterium CF]
MATDVPEKIRLKGEESARIKNTRGKVRLTRPVIIYLSLKAYSDTAVIIRKTAAIM